MSYLHRHIVRFNRSHWIKIDRIHTEIERAVNIGLQAIAYHQPSAFSAPARSRAC